MRLISDDALAAITILQEAEGEPLAGKQAVAEVIRNRMAAKFQSDGTVAGTVLRPFAFSGMNTNAANRLRSFIADDENPIVLDCKRAWDLARGGSNVAGGADSYVNLSIAQPKWYREELVVAAVGRHTFLKLGR